MLEVPQSATVLITLSLMAMIRCQPVHSIPLDLEEHYPSWQAQVGTAQSHYSICRQVALSVHQVHACQYRHAAMPP